MPSKTGTGSPAAAAHSLARAPELKGLGGAGSTLASAGRLAAAAALVGSAGRSFICRGGASQSGMGAPWRLNRRLAGQQGEYPLLLARCSTLAGTHALGPAWCTTEADAGTPRSAPATPRCASFKPDVPASSKGSPERPRRRRPGSLERRSLLASPPWCQGWAKEASQVSEDRILSVTVGWQNGSAAWQWSRRKAGPA